MKPMRELAMERRVQLLVAFVFCASTALYLQWSMFVRGPSSCSRSLMETITPGGSQFNWFDYKFYTTFYEDIGARRWSYRQALAHYKHIGRFEGRLAAPVVVRLKYIACGGLCNQLYSHIHAFIIARALGADVVVPPALRRSSFGDIVSSRTNLTKEERKMQASWLFEPVDSILDVERMAQYWAARGVTVRRTPEMFGLDPRKPDTMEYTGMLRYEQPVGEGCIAAVLRGLPRPVPLRNFTRAAKNVIHNAAQPTVQGDPSSHIPCAYLDTHCSFLSVETWRIPELAAEAGRGIFFNARVEALADEVVQALGDSAAAAGGRFNGLHLRVEADAGEWHEMVGGVNGLMRLYIQAMRNATFDSSSTVYVACGLLSYDASEEWEDIKQHVLGAGMAKSLVYKEQFLSRSKLAGLHTEQVALVDFLVLMKARRLVGLGGSSFSFLLREMRALHGHTKASTYLLYPPGLDVVMSKDFFSRAAVLS